MEMLCIPLPTESESSSKPSKARLRCDWMLVGRGSPSLASNSSDSSICCLAHVVISSSPWRSFSTFSLNKTNEWRGRDNDIDDTDKH